MALGLLALVLAIATSVQVSLGLRPLALLRRGISEIRAGHSKHPPAAVLSEVGPLVEEINALLDAQELEIACSRGRAADLAHGFKTPLAVLIADAARLRERGDNKTAHDIEAVADAMSRHTGACPAAQRHARHRGGGDRASSPSKIASDHARTDAHGERVLFERSIPEDLRIPLDRTDLAEVLGNLLENAARHARCAFA